MAENIMTFALGFLVASLIALALMAPVWRRAVNITRKRLAASSPMSSEDFNADKDRMRAEFAMSARKLEMSVENLRKKAETRLADLDKREREVTGLRHEIEEKVNVAEARGEEIAVLKQRLSTSDALVARQESEIADIKSKLAEAQQVMARQANAIREANSLVEGQKDEIDVMARDIDEKTGDNARKAAALEERDSQLAKCGRAVAEQKMLVSELRRGRGETEETIRLVAAERDAARRDLDAAHERATALAAERNAFRREIDASRAEIAALRASSEELSSEYAARAESERKETAMLRERLSDLAIEVDRASGDIDKIIDPGWSPVANRRIPNGVAQPPAGPVVAGPRPQSLAERIRALQSGIGA